VRDGQRHGPAEGVRGGRRVHEDGNEVRQTSVFEMHLIKDKNLRLRIFKSELKKSNYCLLFP
jgi:hypothetical protein